jgi:hypothetical protein
MHPPQAREIVACAWGRVLRSVLRPVHVDPHYAPWVIPRRWGSDGGITVGQARASERNQHWGLRHRTSRGSPRATASARERAWHVQEKEGDRGLRPCEDHEEPGFGCPHVVTQLQKSVGDGWSRISSAYALQKQRSGSSERGPSSERGSAGDTVGRHIERNVRRESGSPLKTGEHRRKTQGGERSSSSGPHIAKSGGRVAGPGL